MVRAVALTIKSAVFGAAISAARGMPQILNGNSRTTRCVRVYAMEPAAHDDGRLTIIEADTIQLLPAARRQLECLLDAAAIARITQLADPTMAWPEVLALTLGPKLVGLDVSILTWFHVAT